MNRQILFLDACAKADSRTRELAMHLLSTLEGDVTHLSLYEENLSPLTEEDLKKRSAFDPCREDAALCFPHAHQFARADVIVIAAPFWDLSFPSVLKVYLERITVSGITFAYSPQGIPQGKCRAGELIYLTTAGGYPGELDFGFPYVKALAENFYGIPKVRCYSAQGLDILGAEVSDILAGTKAEMTADRKN